MYGWEYLPPWNILCACHLKIKLYAACTLNYWVFLFFVYYNHVRWTEENLFMSRIDCWMRPGRSSPSLHPPPHTHHHHHHHHTHTHSFSIVYRLLLWPGHWKMVIGWGRSSFGNADVDLGSIPRCGKGLFSRSQLSVQTLLRVTVNLNTRCFNFTLAIDSHSSRGASYSIWAQSTNQLTN